MLVFEFRARYNQFNSPRCTTVLQLRCTAAPLPPCRPQKGKPMSFTSSRAMRSFKNVPFVREISYEIGGGSAIAITASCSPDSSRRRRIVRSVEPPIIAVTRESIGKHLLGDDRAAFRCVYGCFQGGPPYGACWLLLGVAGLLVQLLMLWNVFEFNLALAICGFFFTWPIIVFCVLILNLKLVALILRQLQAAFLLAFIVGLLCILCVEVSDVRLVLCIVFILPVFVINIFMDAMPVRFRIISTVISSLINLLVVAALGALVLFPPNDAGAARNATCLATDAPSKVCAADGFAAEVWNGTAAGCAVTGCSFAAAGTARFFKLRTVVSLLPFLKSEYKIVSMANTCLINVGILAVKNLISITRFPHSLVLVGSRMESVKIPVEEANDEIKLFAKRSSIRGSLVGVSARNARGAGLGEDESVEEIEVQLPTPSA